MENTEIVVELWSLAVLLASVFAAILIIFTLPQKKPYFRTVLIWVGAFVVGYFMSFISYSVDISNDFVAILGVTAVVVLASLFTCEGSWSAKIFVSLTMALISNVITFMLCGSIDSFAAVKFKLYEYSPYETTNILFFILVKLIVYTGMFILYRAFLMARVRKMIAALHGNMKIFIWAPLVSVVGFYCINLFTNSNGIFPGTPWFFWLYSMVSIIFVVEFCLIFYAVSLNVRAAKTEAELSIATNIQQAMLPIIFPPFPDRKEFDIYASMDPAKEVGGDFYDLFLVDDSHLAVVVADVSGKGIPAALFMVIGKTLLKDHTQPGEDLGKIFSDVNDMLCQSNSEQLFITAYEAILDLKTGDVQYANAGHEHPFIMRKQPDGSYKYEEMPTVAGVILAGMEGIPFTSASFHMEPGDRLMQYTDGVTEATNSKNQLYGMERLSAFLNDHIDMKPDELLPALRADIDKFVGNAPQFDDITMLCLEYKEKMA